MTARTLKALCFCLAAALFTFAAAAGVHAQDGEISGIVTVDTNEIMEKHPAFMEAQQTLQNEAQQMQQQMQEGSQEEQQSAQQQMQQRSQQLQQEALEEVRQDIQKVADEKGYDYVMDTNALLAGGTDVTDEVIEAIGSDEDEE
ncbi:MAG: OmpH family outer membrane protein [Thermodesulfobacteriota bacterium]